MSAGRVVVVGAGPTGLGCAAALVGHVPVTLVDRIPVVGGESGWRSPRIREMARDVETRGVDARLGSSAVRWLDGGLLIAGPRGVDRLSAPTMFYAGGLRPATPVELGITGDRPAGVVPATVALHLLESRARLWRDVVVVGTSHWADEVTDRIHRLGGRVTVVSQDESRVPAADRTVTGAHGLRLTGRTRVTSLSCTVAGTELELPCDAVVLAGPAHPNRNVEGAVGDTSPGVVFVQPTEPTTPDARYEHGRRAATAWLRDPGGTA